MSSFIRGRLAKPVREDFSEPGFPRNDRLEISMLLYLSIAVVLLLIPYPVQVRQWASYLWLILAALFGAGGVSIMMRYRADGFLFGGLFLILGAGFLMKVRRMKPSAS